MKHFLSILLIVMLALPNTKASDISKYRSDTLIIELGNSSKLIIYVDDQEDLKSLEEFDINEMIKEINLSIDQADDSGEIQITDETGERFLKDTVITVDKRSQIPPVIPETPEALLEPVSQDQPTETAIKTININDLNSLDTLDAVLSNGEQIRLTFNNPQDKEPIRNEYRNYRTSRLNRNFVAVDFGLNNWLQDGSLPTGEDQLYTIKPVGSWYAAGRFLRRVAVGGTVFIDFGISANWYSWKFENRNVRVEENPDMVLFVEDPDISGSKSKLSASYLNLEFIPMLDFSYGKERTNDPESGRKRYTKHVRPNGIRIGLGGYAGYRLDSWTKNVYKDANGEEQTDKHGGTFHLNNLRYGARLQIELDYDFSIFFNYDISTVFEEDKGPELNAVSFGVTLEL